MSLSFHSQFFLVKNKREKTQSNKSLRLQFWPRALDDVDSCKMQQTKTKYINTTKSHLEYSFPYQINAKGNEKNYTKYL